MHDRQRQHGEQRADEHEVDDRRAPFVVVGVIVVSRVVTVSRVVVAAVSPVVALATTPASRVRTP
ncbi:hypothetical protein [Galbitalea soli]|uniref:hypothetical protein n=1 Tax=Galbitalea soli TaxID=1268042 RepID=UPI0017B5C9F0|nr:hypothetical protein [Galbitalea soli]NYJ31254.1 hypothetical protein [Galbitalea soli]